MTKDEFCRKWVSHIRYDGRDERDKLVDERDQSALVVVQPTASIVGFHEKSYCQ